MGIPRLFSASDVRVTVDGELITEFAEGDAISIEKTDDDADGVNGANGATALYFKYNNLADMTLTLLQTSPDNALLQAKYAALQEARRGGITVVVEDGRGESVFVGRGLIKKPPPHAYGTEVGSREWAFILAIEKYALGGNEAV